jgi:rhodanese-related sulfurtransferase
MLRVLRKPISVFSRFVGNHSKAELIELSKNPEVVVIDVRDINEVHGGTIPAANWMHLPLDEFDDIDGLNSKNFELIYEMKKPGVDQHVSRSFI